MYVFVGMVHWLYLKTGGCDNLPYFQTIPDLLSKYSSLSSGVLRMDIVSSGGLLLSFIE